MSEPRPGAGSIQVTVSGPMSGQFAVGNHNTQIQAPAPALSDAELRRLRAAFEQLQAGVATEAPPEHRDQAMEQIATLERAVFADTPALDTIAEAPEWFERDTPKLAGLIRDQVVRPIMGVLGRSGGDARR
jgi:hypothetical protein